MTRPGGRRLGASDEAQSELEGLSNRAGWRVDHAAQFKSSAYSDYATLGL